MKRVLPILWKDLRRQRSLLGAWLLVLAVQAAIDLVRLTSASPTRWLSFYFYRDSSLWFALIVGLGLALLSALAVQEDLPQGDRRFWLTRPISAGNVLAAKLLFLGVLVALQLTFHLGVFAVAGVGPQDLFYAGTEEALEAGALALTFAGFSVLAPNPMSFVLRTLGFLLSGAATAILLFNRNLGFVGPSGVSDGLRTEGWAASLLIAVMVWCGLWGLILLAWRYLDRTESRGRAAQVIALLVTVVFFAWPTLWRWDFFPADGYPVMQIPPGSPISFKVEQATLYWGGGGGSAGGVPFSSVAAAVGGVRLPDGTWAVPELAHHAELVWPSDNHRLSWNAWPNQRLKSNAPPVSTEVLGAALAPLRLLETRSTPYRQSFNVINLPRKEFARLQREPAELRVRLQAGRLSYRVSPPLDLGAGFIGYSDGVRVSLVGRWSGRRLSEANANVLGAGGERFAIRSLRFSALFRGSFSIDGRPISENLVPWPTTMRTESLTPFRDLYVAVNRAEGTAVLASDEANAWGGEDYLRGLVVKRTTLLVLSPEQEARNAKMLETRTPAPSEAWLRAAKLVRVQVMREGTLPGEIVAENLRLDPRATPYPGVFFIPPP